MTHESEVRDAIEEYALAQMILHTMLSSRFPPNSGALAVEIADAIKADRGE